MSIAQFAFMLALCGAASVVQAQSASVPAAKGGGTANGADPVMVKNLVVFASCAVIRDRPAIVSFLNGNTFGNPKDAAVRKIASDNSTCNRGGDLRFNQVLFAGNAAEVLYRAYGFYFAAHKESLKKAPVTDGGVCIAAIAPNDVDDLLASLPTTEEERVVLAKMEIVIRKCLPGVSQEPALRRAAIMAGAFPAVYQTIGRP